MSKNSHKKAKAKLPFVSMDFDATMRRVLQVKPEKKIGKSAKVKK